MTAFIPDVIFIDMYTSLFAYFPDFRGLYCDCWRAAENCGEEGNATSDRTTERSGKICTDEAPFTISKKLSKTILNQLDFNVDVQQGVDFFTGGSIIMNFELNEGYVYYRHTTFHKMLTDGLELCGLLMY